MGTIIVAVRSLVILVIAGCYQPSPPANAPCGPGNACPTGQMCIAGVCRTEVPEDDAPVAPSDTTTPDMPGPVDAMPDAPNLSGCADGEREAFPSLTSHPTIAGCAATWTGSANLRADTTNAACGDDLGTCAAPADACAPGWHICGLDGQPTELSNRASQDECAEAGGATDAFVMAMTHCTTVCTYDLPLGCPAAGDCGEPVCCGAGCRTNQGCLTAVYPVTAIVSDNIAGCGNLPSAIVTGVLCCQ